MKKVKTIPDTTKRLANFSISEVLDFIPFDKEGKPLEGILKDKEYCGHMIHMTSLRYRVYKAKGVKCCVCGLEGKHFGLDLPITSNRPHFNLYAVDEDGEEVLMTKDHIQPRSKGGTDHLDNLQPMCARCNFSKGNKWKG